MEALSQWDQDIVFQMHALTWHRVPKSMCWYCSSTFNDGASGIKERKNRRFGCRFSPKYAAHYLIHLKSTTSLPAVSKRLSKSGWIEKLALAMVGVVSWAVRSNRLVDYVIHSITFHVAGNVQNGLTPTRRFLMSAPEIGLLGVYRSFFYVDGITCMSVKSGREGL
jgi:hypothetical protein